MRRHADWWQRLQRTVADFDGVPFEWGRTDCAHFAGACVEAVTGRDVIADWRGTYDTRLQSRARLKWYGFASVEDAAADVLKKAGAKPIPPMFAAVGDIGITGDGVLAVRMPRGFVARGENGKFGIAKVEKAWAIAWPN